jgi:hypothetical protein
MQGERAAGIAAPLHELEHTRRQPGLVGELHQERAHRRCQGARLEYHGVAERQGRHDVTVREMGGEVEGPEHREHAAWVDGRACTGPSFQGGDEAHPVAEGDVHLRSDEPRLLLRLPARFADLPRDEPAELVGPRAGAVAEAA